MFKVTMSGSSQFLLRMSGPINEDADFTPVRFPTKVPIEIDMTEVTMINSMGLRAFAAWASSLENKQIEFSHVPKFFADQLNMIPNLIPKWTKINSFYVPYFNAEKELEKRVLYRAGLEFEKINGEVVLKHPEVKDDEGNEYEIDVIPLKFFSFLQKYS